MLSEGSRQLLPETHCGEKGDPRKAGHISVENGPLRSWDKIFSECPSALLIFLSGSRRVTR